MMAEISRQINDPDAGMDLFQFAEDRQRVIGRTIHDDDQFIVVEAAGDRSCQDPANELVQELGGAIDAGDNGQHAGYAGRRAAMSREPPTGNRNPHRISKRSASMHRPISQLPRGTLAAGGRCNVRRAKARAYMKGRFIILKEVHASIQNPAARTTARKSRPV